MKKISFSYFWMEIYIEKKGRKDREWERKREERILRLIRISSDFTNLSSLLLLCKYVGTEQIMFHNLFTNIYTYCSSSFCSINEYSPREATSSVDGSRRSRGCFYVLRVRVCICVYVSPLPFVIHLLHTANIPFVSSFSLGIACARPRFLSFDFNNYFINIYI